MNTRIVYSSQQGNPITNSLLVAEKFGKRHDNVLRAIERLIENSEFVSPQNSVETENQAVRKMFYRTEGEIPLNNGTTAMRKTPIYLMNRDGFTLLAMGFTGKDAIKFKLDYIQAFNLMEQKVKQMQPSLPTSYPEALRLLADQAERMQQLTMQTTAQAEEIAQLKESTAYLDSILSSRSLLKVTQIAQDYGMSAKAFNLLLSEKKIQHRVGDQWIVYAPYLNKGYVASETLQITHHNGRVETKMQTRWTQKGRIFLYERLKRDGILPIIERN